MQANAEWISVAGNAATVIGVALVGAYVRSEIKALETKIQLAIAPIQTMMHLAISQNNEVLLAKINGAYVKKDMLEARLDGLEHREGSHTCRHDERLDKIEREIRLGKRATDAR